MRHTVLVEGREAASVADCPHKISSPEGIAWCRAFTLLHAGHAGFRADAKAAADARIEAAGLKPVQAQGPLSPPTPEQLDALFQAFRAKAEFLTEVSGSLGDLARSIEDAQSVRMIKGRPAGRKAKHDRRRCVRHAKAWADSCRKCQR